MRSHVWCACHPIIYILDIGLCARPPQNHVKKHHKKIHFNSMVITNQTNIRFSIWDLEYNVRFFNNGISALVGSLVVKKPIKITTIVNLH